MEKYPEMVKLDTNIFATGPVKPSSYALNIPSEKITFVQAGKVQRKNESKMSDPEKNAFINAITSFNNLGWAQ